jgi:hypothetical protein
MPGVTVEVTPYRYYPVTDLAPHLIGTTGPIYEEEWEEYKEKGYSYNDKVGKSGIEMYAEEALHGIDGEITHTLDKDGNIINSEVTKEPIPGKTVMLTIDKNLQSASQKILEKNIKVKNEAKDYIFTGLLKCDHCNNNMAGNCTTRPLKDGLGTYKYYRCPKRTRDYNCDNHISIREEQVEKYLLENVEQLMYNYIVESESAENKKPIKSNRSQIEKKMQKLNDLYMNDFISMEEYKSKRAELESQIIDEPKTEPRNLSAIKDFLDSDVKTLYKTLNDIEKRTLWRSVIQEIYVSGKEVKRVIFL